jgi:uncharacterized protein (TIGR02246 family)
MISAEQAIRHLFEVLYPRAVVTRDLQAYTALYTEDALWIRPGRTPRRGQSAIAEGFLEMLAGQRIDASFTADEIEQHSGSATVLGHSEARIADAADGRVQRVRFHALWIVREQREQWLIHRQIWTPTL